MRTLVFILGTLFLFAVAAVLIWTIPGADYDSPTGAPAAREMAVVPAGDCPTLAGLPAGRIGAEPVRLSVPPEATWSDLRRDLAVLAFLSPVPAVEVVAGEVRYRIDFATAEAIAAEPGWEYYGSAPVVVDRDGKVQIHGQEFADVAGGIERWPYIDRYRLSAADDVPAAVVVGLLARVEGTLGKSTNDPSRDRRLSVDFLHDHAGHIRSVRRHFSSLTIGGRPDGQRPVYWIVDGGVGRGGAEATGGVDLFVEVGAMTLSADGLADAIGRFLVRLRDDRGLPLPSIDVWLWCEGP